MNEDERRLTLELSDFPRSYQRIADALRVAASLDPELDHVDRAGAFTRELVQRYMVIDVLAVRDVFMAITGYLAQRSGLTPQQIHEEFFKTAPDDAWWREKMNGGST